MAIDFFEREVSSAQQRFNETFGVLTVCDLKLRQSVIVSICLLGRTGEMVKASQNESEKKKRIIKFMRIRNALNNIFTEIENHQKERRDHDERTRYGKNPERAGYGDLPELRQQLYPGLDQGRG